MSTQWRIGPSGPTGLDYTALPAVMRLSGVQPADRADVFSGIQTMESAALDMMYAKK